jgi:hypothetical protein
MHCNIVYCNVISFIEKKNTFKFIVKYYILNFLTEYLNLKKKSRLLLEQTQNQQGEVIVSVI